jgi:signal peptidase I
LTTSWKRELREWGKTIFYTIAVSLLLRVAVVEAFMVPTGSMRPTILEGDRLLGTKFYYWFRDPHPREIVIFHPPENARQYVGPEVKRLVKRVVAVEGDKIEIANGVVKVNGLELNEPYIDAPPDYRLEEMTVPPDHFFVLGDNRNQSLDSHFWGFVPESELIAHVFARYWPLDRIGSL